MTFNNSRHPHQGHHLRSDHHRRPVQQHRHRQRQQGTSPSPTVTTQHRRDRHLRPRLAWHHRVRRWRLHGRRLGLGQRLRHHPRSAPAAPHSNPPSTPASPLAAAAPPTSASPPPPRRHRLRRHRITSTPPPPPPPWPSPAASSAAAATLSVSSSITWTGGGMRGSGTTSLLSGATMSLNSGASDIDIDDSRTLATQPGSTSHLVQRTHPQLQWLHRPHHRQRRRLLHPVRQHVDRGLLRQLRHDLRQLRHPHQGHHLRSDPHRRPVQQHRHRQRQLRHPHLRQRWQRHRRDRHLRPGSPGTIEFGGGGFTVAASGLVNGSGIIKVSAGSATHYNSTFHANLTASGPAHPPTSTSPPSPPPPSSSPAAPPASAPPPPPPPWPSPAASSAAAQRHPLRLLLHHLDRRRDAGLWHPPCSPAPP